MADDTAARAKAIEANMATEALRDYLGRGRAHENVGTGSVKDRLVFVAKQIADADNPLDPELLRELSGLMAELRLRGEQPPELACEIVSETLDLLAEDLKRRQDDPEEGEDLHEAEWAELREALLEEGAKALGASRIKN